MTPSPNVTTGTPSASQCVHRAVIAFPSVWSRTRLRRHPHREAVSRRVMFYECRSRDGMPRARPTEGIRVTVSIVRTLPQSSKDQRWRSTHVTRFGRSEPRYTTSATETSEGVIRRRHKPSCLNLRPTCLLNGAVCHGQQLLDRTCTLVVGDATCLAHRAYEDYGHVLHL